MTIDPTIVTTIIAGLAKLIEVAPGVAATLLGTKTDEEAMEHANATLAASQDLGERLDATTEEGKRKFRERQAEATRRTTLPAPDPVAEPVDPDDEP